jgi:hypothetical protein
MANKPNELKRHSSAAILSPEADKRGANEPIELPNPRGGPKTLAGKAISARNSWRHGYYSREAKEARRQERAKALAAFEVHRHSIEAELRDGPALDADSFSAFDIDLAAAY